MEERLQKLLARAGYGSRRACEEIIGQQRVTVNGRIATLGVKADPAVDTIQVDGVRLRLPETFDYIMLNKPRGVISDESATGNWPRARDLIPVGGHLYPVGRLDVQSEGLMLFTNDGNLAHILTHPRYEHPKTYRVLVEGSPTEKTLDVWRRGIVIDGERTGPADITRLRKSREGALLEVTVREGRKRQLRRVAGALGHPVLRLERIRLGPLELGDLPSGAWRRLTSEEVAALQAVRRSSRPRRLPSPREQPSPRDRQRRSGVDRQPSRTRRSSRRGSRVR